MKKTILFELLFFLIVPLLIWNVGRDILGDYWAILLSTVPALLFGIIQFTIQKQYNFTAITTISVLLVGTIVDLLSPNAEQMLWNGIYFSYFYSLVFLVSIMIKRPIALYFAVDVAYLQGYKREDSKALFFRKELISGFLWLTALFSLRYIFLGVLKSWLLIQHGVHGYNNMMITISISNWVFNGLIFVGFIILSNKINQVVNQLYNKEEVEVENEDVVAGKVSS